ncbi:MAG: phage tail sheath subtilisin-like domain-containing protein [Nostoc sp. DedQUE12a]|nr:phage tail sheath subtilisin-like domain-containing protein [Nostoc sp. DedQUE12a]
MATTYFSPGVYVQEVPSAVQPIAGVGTSTAGFIGVIPDEIIIPTSPVQFKSQKITKQSNQKDYDLATFPVNDASGTFEVRVGQKVLEDALLTNVKDGGKKFTKAQVVLKDDPEADFTVNYIGLFNQVTNELIGKVEQKKEVSSLPLKNYPVNEAVGTYSILVDGKSIPNETKVTLKNDEPNERAKVIFEPALKLPDATTTPQTITLNYQVFFPTFKVAPTKEVKLCTNFNEFKKFFGDFSSNPQQNQLAHAVYGFFNNGGTRCYVTRVKTQDEISVDALEVFEAIDEIAIVVAPGVTDKAARSAIVTHCQQKTGDRFAIFDCQETDTASSFNEENDNKPDNSNYAAFYFPWIQVFDPATKAMNPNGNGLIYVPPSGHIAGIYARVDTQRGVHKAPANEVVFGALGVKQLISKNQQDGLNPKGINCIRDLNGNIRVWGARTIGGDDNGEFKYINVRRLFLFLRESIDEGTQWTVFEPNTPDLWARIRRSVTAFLTNVWRSGALFGSTPEQAFYVKCDEENNPPEVRDAGQVMIEIGVAVVKPAEFVIFRLSQWAGPGSK